jgi:hypothetical protein
MTLLLLQVSLSAHRARQVEAVVEHLEADDFADQVIRMMATVDG